ncbi:MAG: hypothetical protein K0U70_00470 [Actinomycetia bacterium]|nr:hypothetical protein [Actinomycetes bacterium]MCH9709470.1 hypothetical protein [Actinomycetes bacterium]MCH9766249.1 hypothetical protein [Actinomycetes bacterium]
MAPFPRIKIAVLSALVAGGALAAAGQAGAQPAPVDPALPPGPGDAAPAPNQVFTYTPIGEGGVVPGPAPAPPPAGAPYVAPVENGSFGNTGQMSYLRELWNMRNSNDFFEALYPSQLDPAMADAMGVRQMPMLAPGELPPGVVPPAAAPGAPAAPAPAPPPVWPPVGMVPLPAP